MAEHPAGLRRVAGAPRRLAGGPGRSRTTKPRWSSTCPAATACSAEADSLLVVAAVSLGADPGGEPWRPATDAAPPADLADRIVARVATERRRPPLSPGGAGADGDGRRGGRARRRRDARRPAAPATVRPVAFVRLAQGVDAEATVAPDGGGSLVGPDGGGPRPRRHLRPLAHATRWRLPRARRGGHVPPGRATDDVDVSLRSALPAEEMGRVWATTPDGDVALDTDVSPRLTAAPRP